MIFFGHIADGRVVFDEPTSLPDGTLVRVEVIESADTRSTLLERLGDVVGTVVGLPEDAARNVDHYLYGTPKQ